MFKLLKLAVFTILLSLPVQAFAGHYDIPFTDETSSVLFSFFDLRERESFVQVTNTDSLARTVHVQIFDVGNNCIENNFFDDYTPNDTHIYNMRDILTNDGDPSGVVLPDGAYGIVAISIVDSDGDIDDSEDFLMGNFRVVDNSGYEYRTNSLGEADSTQPDDQLWYFNFNNNSGVTLTDVNMMNLDQEDGEWVAGPTEAYWAMDVDIYNLDEVPFSCRDVTFSCVDQDNPLLEELLEDAGTNVAAFEYGINEALPHSRGGELLCPGNVIEEGWVFLSGVSMNDSGDARGGFVGLNNGNGRGSMDSWWHQSDYAPSPPVPGN